MFKMLPALAAALALSLTATAGQAQVTITAGPGNIQNDENVLYGGSLISSGTLIQGQTQQSNFIVDFTGTEPLQSFASGQARIEALDGAFTNLSIGLENPAAGFQTIIFNLNAAAAGPVDITGTTWDGNSLTGTFPLGQGGQNFFSVVATAANPLKTVSIASTVPLQDIRQVRIGGAAIVNTPPPPGGEVPEPGTMGLLATGLLPLAGLIRRRKAA